MFRSLLIFLLFTSLAATVQSEDDPITIADLAESTAVKPVLENETEFELTLETGEVIDVTGVFRPYRETLATQLRTRLQAKPASLVRIQRPESDHPLLVAGRRGKQLDGPFASFTPEGNLFAAITYRRGERDSALLTWDVAGRPYVFAQYSDGKLNGLRCLFHACSDACQTGHLWLVQQWKDGELRETHFVNKQGKTVTLDARYDSPFQSKSHASDALAALSEFERRFDADEANLKRYVTKYYIRERRAIVMRTQAASQARIAFLKNAYAASPTGYGRSSVTVLTGTL